MLRRIRLADSVPLSMGRAKSMMGDRQVVQGALFYEFSLERHVPADHVLRAIDRQVELSAQMLRQTESFAIILFRAESAGEEDENDTDVDEAPTFLRR